jgi:hypothetical protein
VSGGRPPDKSTVESRKSRVESRESRVESRKHEARSHALPRVRVPWAFGFRLCAFGFRLPASSFRLCSLGTDPQTPACHPDDECRRGVRHGPHTPQDGGLRGQVCPQPQSVAAPPHASSTPGGPSSRALGFRLSAFGFRPPAPCFRLPTSGLRLPASGLRQRYGLEVLVVSPGTTTTVMSS